TNSRLRRSRSRPSASEKPTRVFSRRASTPQPHGATLRTRRVERRGKRLNARHRLLRRRRSALVDRHHGVAEQTALGGANPPPASGVVRAPAPTSAIRTLEFQCGLPTYLRNVEPLIPR